MLRWDSLMNDPPALDHAMRAPPVTKRHALLINPFYRKDPHASFGKHVLTPSLALTSVAATTPPEWTVRYWDENLLQGAPPVDPFPEVVGITVHLTFAERAYELARFYRSRGAKVIFGGLHVTSCPDEARPHADALVVGEGVRVWGDLLRDVDAGTLKDRYDGSYRRPYREEPAPRRDILDRAAFLTTSSLIATRGCHNRCGFCYLATDGVDMPYQVADVEHVVEQITRNREPYGVFIDNNLGSRPTYLRALCKGLRRAEKIWSAAVTIDVADDPSLVREMALAGCTGVFVGFESLTGRNLDDSRKKSPRPEDYARRVAIFHDNGIQVNASFVVGFDHDDRGTFARTAEWVETNRIECATFHILTPYPGTPLHAQMKSEGRILHERWDEYDTAHVVFRPKNMTPDELAEGYAWLYRRLFSHASIWARRPREGTEALAYLGMSYLYKRSNWLWPLVIKRRLTHMLWSPLVEISRRRHLRFREKLAARPIEGEVSARSTRLPLYAGV